MNPQQANKKYRSFTFSKYRVPSSKTWTEFCQSQHEKWTLIIMLKHGLVWLFNQ